MKSKNVIMGLFLLLIIALVAYLDSPFSIINKDYSYTADVSEPAVAQPIDESPPTDVPVLEEKLEKREKVDGYIVETYEEYEVYKDKNGKVIKSEPTSKTDILRYWDYSEH
ncbi:hypothetical protein [Neobacillus ginsengisoli]|uniref:DUF3139 domain-containing protein n=1 Tax=Neobacillus ginsengisoli TaxID=904295 RepID=A0ABT9XWW0_9BACI|nr:hypothetical protein [Neobacillus ginsengisoli]MDQ0200060.1 hypothetical protein [Neobacillus ginsengisoli]